MPNATAPQPTTTNPAPEPTRAEDSRTAATWKVAPWVTDISVDGDLIEASHVLGTVPAHPVNSSESLTVIALQRYELVVEANRITAVRHSLGLLTGGVSLDPTDARELARLLSVAADLIEGSA